MGNLTPIITNYGNGIMLEAIVSGKSIVFTRFALGNGQREEDSDIIGNEIMNVGIISITKGDNYATMKAQYDNSELGGDFLCTEIGLMAKNGDDGEEHLYAYAYSEDGIDFVPAQESGSLIETELSMSVTIGSAENVYAVLSEASGYVTKIDFDRHLNAKNPHKITKEDIGLDKVENISSEEKTIEFVPTNSLMELNSGQNLSSLFGKVATAVHSLIAHLSDRVSHITSAERAEWNSKANKNHTHTPAGIGAATANHTHTPASIGASATNHTHTAAQVGASPSNHTHTAAQVGAAASGHTHTIFSNSISVNGDVTIGENRDFCGSMAGSDVWRIGGFGYDDSGYSCWDVGDNGDECVYIRQLEGASGGYGNVRRQATIFDANGKSSFPVEVTSPKVWGNNLDFWSDRKRKNIHGSLDIETSKGILFGLNPVRFDYKDEEEHREHFGYIAQDVFALMQSLGLSENCLYTAKNKPTDNRHISGDILTDEQVKEMDDADVDWGVNYIQLIAPMVQVIKAHEERINRLEGMINA